MANESLRSVYAKCCANYGKDPSETQYDAWREVLGSYPPAIVSEAATRHLGDTTIDLYTKKLRGSFMPSPAELKATVRQIEAELKRSERQWSSCGKCDVHGIIEVMINGSVEGTKVRAVYFCECTKRFNDGRRSA